MHLPRAAVLRDPLVALLSLAGLEVVDGRERLDEAFERITRGLAYRDEAQAWLDFYREHVVSVHAVYFGPEFYRRHYATDQQQQQYMMLLADPIHPNALGHHLLAEALLPLVCPRAPQG